jgi:hypothetical protein
MEEIILIIKIILIIIESILIVKIGEKIKKLLDKR